jgi:heme/copper-type cytochrome/quinol oxidase subunit 3
LIVLCCFLLIDIHMSLRSLAIDSSSLVGLVGYSLLFSSCSLLSELDCNRDSIREYTSCYEILCYHMLSLLVVFIISEIMFVWVYFWSSSSVTYSSSSLQLFQTIQDIRTSQTHDPNALTSTNTVLLSFSGISLGCTYHIRVTHTLYHSPYLLCFLLSHLFGSWQIKEFQDVNFYLNECSTSSVFFYLIGLHFFHVGVGIILLFLFLIWDAQLTRSILNFINAQLRLTQHHVVYSLQLVYWHFVELLWLLIYYVLYN